MAGLVSIKLNTAAFAQQIKRFGDVDVKRVLAKGLNRTVFEMRDAETAHVGKVFEFAGPSTRSFLTKSSGSGQAFRFSLAKPDRLEASLQPAPGTARLLEPHAFGDTIRGGDEKRLTIEGQIATPVAAKRSARGRVGKRRGRAFVAGRAVLQRVGKGARSTVKVLFALVPQAKLAPRFDFERVARDTAQRVLAQKVREEFAKIRL